MTHTAWMVFDPKGEALIFTSSIDPDFSAYSVLKSKGYNWEYYESMGYILKKIEFKVIEK